MSTLKVNTLLAGDGNPLTPVAIPALDKRFATAWVNFNGVGVVAIRSAYNVASITDIGLGDYGVNFAVPMANTNYAGFLSIGTAAGAAVISYLMPGSTVNQFKVRTANTSPVTVDVDFVNVAIFGGQA